MIKILLICISTFLLNTAFFGQQTGKILSTSQMKNDISVLKAELKLLHPGLYRYNTPEQVNSYFNELNLKTNTNLDIKDFYLLLSEFTAKIRCGHTFLNPLNLNDSVSKTIFSTKLIPLYFKIIENKIIITHNVSDNQEIFLGDEIVRINGVSSKSIINTLLKVSRGDGNNSKEKRLSNISLLPEDSYGNSLFDIYYPLYYKVSDTFTIEVIHKNKKYVKGVVALTSDTRKKVYEKKYGAIPEDEKTWNYTTLTENTSYIKFGTFAFWNSNFNWNRYLDSVFTSINNQVNISNLIIDLRGNEGGSGEIRNLILSYITNKPISGEGSFNSCYRSLSIPDSLKKHLSTWDRSFAQAKNPEEYFKNEIGLYQKLNESNSDSIYPNKNRFKGKVYLLTDAICSSATFDMAWTFQYNKLGKIIGEKTGGTKQGLNGGQMFFLHLPNSQIEIDLPILYYYHKNSKDEGVIPDYIVKSKVKDLASGVDTQMEYTKLLIKSNN